jgi:hypothetical protein
MEQTMLAKLKDDGSGEERFLFVTADMQAGKMLHTSDPVTEAEMRKHLQDAGMPELEINKKFAHARNNPV